MENAITGLEIELENIKRIIKLYKDEGDEFIKYMTDKKEEFERAISILKKSE